MITPKPLHNLIPSCSQHIRPCLQPRPADLPEHPVGRQESPLVPVEEVVDAVAPAVQALSVRRPLHPLLKPIFQCLMLDSSSRARDFSEGQVTAPYPSASSPRHCGHRCHNN